MNDFSPLFRAETIEMKQLKELLAPLVHDLHDESAGWATQAVLDSIRNTVLTLLAAWQFVLVAAVFLTLGGGGWLLAVANAALGIYMLYIRNYPRQILLWFIPPAMSVLALSAMLASADIDSVLVFASAWLLNSAAVTAGLILLNRWVVPSIVTIAILAAGTIAVRLPEWGPELPSAMLVTMIAIIFVVRLGFPFVLTRAAESDMENTRAEQAAQEAEIKRVISLQVAEDARVLHDTAINTLAVIANGGVGIADAQKVRTHCAQDVAVLEALRVGRREHDMLHRMLDDIASLTLLPIHRTGLDDEDISELAQQLEPEVIEGIWGAAREAIINAAKHSQADEVMLNIEHEEDGLTVRVRDDGVGFSRAIPEGRGLANSIFGRAHDHGFEARVESEPGSGTTVILHASLRTQDAPTETPRLEPPVAPTEVVAAIHRRSGIMWGAGATVVTTVLTLTNTLNYQPTLFAMISIMVVASALGILISETPPPLPLTLFLIIATGVTFYLSAAATQFGSYQAIHWQALAATTPFIILLSLRPARRIRLIGISVWVIAIGAAAYKAESINSLVVMLFGGLVGLLFAWGWASFMKTVAELSHRTAIARQRAFQDQVRVNAENATQASYQRWVDAGLDSALELLRDIANGQRNPHDPETHAACADEESYLRQLVLISPDLVYLGQAAMSVLRHSNENLIPLRLRLGGLDAPDEATAQLLMEIVTTAMSKADSGQMVSASVFPASMGLQLTIVGPVLSTIDLPELPENMAAEFTIQKTTGVTTVTCSLQASATRSETMQALT